MNILSAASLEPDLIASQYVYSTEDSINVPVELVRVTEALDYAKLARGKKKMADALGGNIGKRKPIWVIARGDGTYAVIDGNNTLTALRELGAKTVPAIVYDAPFQKHVSNGESLCRVNTEVQCEFESLVRGFQALLGGQLIVVTSLEDPQELARRAETLHCGDFSKVIDLLSARWTFESCEALCDAFNALKDDFRVVQLREDKSDSECHGTLNLRLSNGTIAELSLYCSEP